MPGVYTPEKVEQQVAGLRRCLELTESRLRFSSEEYREILSNGEQFQRDYFENYLIPILGGGDLVRQLAESMFEQTLFNSRKAYLHDLHCVRKFRDLIIATMDGTNDSLQLVMQLLTHLITWKQCAEIAVQASVSRVRGVTQTYNAALRQHGNKQHPEVKAAADQLQKARKLAEFQQKHFDNTSDLPFYENIAQILANEVFNPIEKDLKKYLKTELVAGTTTVNFSLNDIFTDLVKQNIRKKEVVAKKISARHTKAAEKHPADAALFLIDAENFLREAGIASPRSDYSSLEEMFAVYRMQYTLQERLNAVDQQDAESIAADLLLLEDQAKAAVIALEQQEDHQVRLEQERAKAAEAAKQLKKQECEELELRRIKRRAEREAAKAEKEARKHKRRQELVAQTKRVTTNVNAEIEDSRFRIAPQLVIDNAGAIKALLDPAIHKYRYSNIGTLVEALGGELRTGTGSSHQYIYFSGFLYQEFEIWEDSKPKPAPVVATAKAPIAKPHGKAKDSAFVYHHNLKLVRKAIESILPDGWRKLLDLDTVPQSRTATLGV